MIHPASLPLQGAARTWLAKWGGTWASSSRSSPSSLARRWRRHSSSSMLLWMWTCGSPPWPHGATVLSRPPATRLVIYCSFFFFWCAAFVVGYHFHCHSLLSCFRTCGYIEHMRIWSCKEKEGRASYLLSFAGNIWYTHSVCLVCMRHDLYMVMHQKGRRETLSCTLNCNLVEQS